MILLPYPFASSLHHSLVSSSYLTLLLCLPTSFTSLILLSHPISLSTCLISFLLILPHPPASSYCIIFQRTPPSYLRRFNSILIIFPLSHGWYSYLILLPHRPASWSWHNFLLIIIPHPSASFSNLIHLSYPNVCMFCLILNLIKMW